jgi:hypothetical protein
VPVVLMHMQGEPGHMQADPHYDDVVAEVHGFLVQRLFAAEMAGIAKKNLLIDLGFGFGKTTAHNMTLLARSSASWNWACRCWPACRASAAWANSLAATRLRAGGGVGGRAPDRGPARRAHRARA